MGNVTISRKYNFRNTTVSYLPVLYIYIYKLNFKRHTHGIRKRPAARRTAFAKLALSIPTCCCTRIKNLNRFRIAIFLIPRRGNVRNGAARIGHQIPMGNQTQMRAASRARFSRDATGYIYLSISISILTSSFLDHRSFAD